MCRVKLMGQVLLELSRGLALVKSSPPRALHGVETATFFSFLIPVIHKRYPTRYLRKK
jgi:hypothetical protein